MILIGWIAVQVTLIGYVSWLQPAMAVVGVVALVLALLLPTDDARASHARH